MPEKALEKQAFQLLLQAFCHGVFDTMAFDTFCML
jgi:hypothetical protein